MKLSDSHKERTAILAALAAQPQPLQGECPSDAQIAAFIDGQVTDSERKSLLKHFHTCPTCYAIWQAAAEHIQTSPPTFAMRWAQLWRWLLGEKNTAGRWAVAMGLTLAIVLPLVWQWQHAAQETPLTLTHQLLQKESGTYTQELANNLRLPNEAQSIQFGFNGTTTPPNAAQLSFTAGAWHTREMMRGVQQPVLPIELQQATQTSIYYDLGSWLVALQISAELPKPMPASFWQIQLQQLAIFKATLPVNERIKLEQIEPLLAVLNTPNPAEPTYDQLTRRVQQLINQFSL